MKGFYHIWACRSSWSCYPDAANKLSFPYSRKLHIKFDFDWPSGFGEEDVCGRTTTDRRRRRTTDGHRSRRLRCAKNEDRIVFCKTQRLCIKRTVRQIKAPMTTTTTTTIGSYGSPIIRTKYTLRTKMIQTFLPLKSLSKKALSVSYGEVYFATYNNSESRSAVPILIDSVPNPQWK